MCLGLTKITVNYETDPDPHDFTVFHHVPSGDTLCPTYAISIYYLPWWMHVLAIIMLLGGFSEKPAADI